MNKNIELLAPAGTYEAFVAAIENGADAVYMGGKLFNARANATNFDIDELSKIVQYAHLRNSNIYITMNTLLDDTELNDALDFAYELYKIGIDAVIVQDLGLAKVLHEYIPDLHLHASTQMTIYNLNGVKELEKLGFKRVVLARELSLKEISYICENTNLEIEVFIHGALCVSYSGQCLLSSMIGDRSGNRGKCAQPCRLPYELIENNKTCGSGYLLSPKDLCTIELLNKYPNVHSLKIEGRMKSPEYVATVVHTYRKYIDEISNDSYKEVSSEDKNNLKQIFSRGDFTDAYLLQKQGNSMMCYEKDEAYNTASKELLNVAKESYSRGFVKKSKIKVSMLIKKNKNIIMQINDYQYNSNIMPEIATNQATSNETIKVQINKTGSTPFEIEKLEIDMDENLFVRISAINDIRRKALENYQNILIQNMKRNINTRKLETLNNHRKIDGKKETSLFLYKVNSEHLKLKNVDNYYFSLKDAAIKLDIIEKFNGKKYVVFPTIAKSNYETLIKNNILKIANKVDGFVISNIGELEFVKAFGKEIIANYTFNTFNSYAIDYLKSSGISKIILSPELTKTQINKLSSQIPLELMVYGRQCVMTSEYCPVGSIKGNFSKSSKCSKPCLSSNKYYLKDRIGMKFLVLPDNIDCQSTIYNSKITSIESKSLNIDSIKIDIIDEDISEIQTIIDNHSSGQKLSGDNYTNGHLVRPV